LIKTNSSKEENGFWRSIHRVGAAGRSLLPTSVRRGQTSAQTGQTDGSSVSRLHTIWVDAGFEGEPFAVGDELLRLDQSKWYCDLSKPKPPGAQETLGSGEHLAAIDCSETMNYCPKHRRRLFTLHHHPYYGQAFGIEFDPR